MMLFNFVSLVLFLLIAVGVAVPRPVERPSRVRSLVLLSGRDGGADSSSTAGSPSSLANSPSSVASSASSSVLNHTSSSGTSSSQQVSFTTLSGSLSYTLPSPVPSSSEHAGVSSPPATLAPSSSAQSSVSSVGAPTPSSISQPSLPSSALSPPSEPASASQIVHTSASQGSPVPASSSLIGSPISSSVPTSAPSSSSPSAPSTSIATPASSAVSSSLFSSASVPASASAPSSASISASSHASASVTTSSGTPSASRVPLPSPTTGPAEIAAYLDGHNIARHLAGTPPLEWDGALADAAHSYASQCRLQHSNGALGPFGENLVAGTGIFPASAAVAQFVGDGPSSQGEFTHWSQVVWKATTRLGCGVALCEHIFDQPATYHVCLYDPVGNVVGDEQTNL